ncbi:hypothetical protein ACFVT9_29120 [Kitasatospora cineracea]|uniref:hypothetical protein n=1 Tax=Kitasatospora cineracea TaxID=88074 RepID=UPI0036D79DD8
MTPADLQKLLVNHLPSVPGIASAQPWSESPYGVVVTVAGAGAVYWTITGASNTAAPEGASGLGPQSVPELTGGKAATADVEQALLTALAAGADQGHVLRAERYSTRPQPPAVRYGITVDTADRWGSSWRALAPPPPARSSRATAASNPTPTCSPTARWGWGGGGRTDWGHER